LGHDSITPAATGPWPNEWRVPSTPTSLLLREVVTKRAQADVPAARPDRKSGASRRALSLFQLGTTTMSKLGPQ
jgi:hypothetical protein